MNKVERITDFVVSLKGNVRCSRYYRPVQKLLDLRSGDYLQAIDDIKTIAAWAKAKGLNWEIETILKRFLELEKLKAEYVRRS